MTTVHEQIAALQRQVRDLTDRVELRELLDGFVGAGDDNRLDESAFRRTFTEDARFSRMVDGSEDAADLPELSGEVGLSDFIGHMQDAATNYASTLHHVSNYA